ncbi:DUF3348 domain-containing protein [Aquincola sp. MAHUQ-54]|uniref:DUF3348 domain-containing protein n=1 Tax=Aquincola agrisoli TaxID=3119538 RepID=A0AAW9Q0Y6_9BURK
MVRGPRRTDLTGLALIRLLGRLTEVEVPGAKQGFAERLSQWLGWVDAIALSAALNGTPAAAAPEAPAAGREEADCTAVRAAMARAIVQACAAADDDPEAGFPAYRRRYLARQQAMEAGIAPLRGRLRSALGARSPELARLAAVDAVMEQVLAVRESSLLATVPAMLAKHFERLRQAGLAPEGGGEAPPDAAWPARFREDMQAVLLAELDVRFQPIEGLLAALRQQPA